MSAEAKSSSAPEEQTKNAEAEPAVKPDVSKFMDRFKALHKRREDSRRVNHEHVVEEDRQAKLPKNFESKRRRQEWELQEIEARKAAEERGEDYDRLKALETQADVADKVEAAKRRKKNPDQGFANYESMSMRQYERLTNGIKPNLESYQKMKAVVGEEEFYPTANTLIQGSHYPTDAALDKLSNDVHGQ
ncbi:GCIP-interacting protein p29 [Aphelenchoides avenae]|nr:GCIP-interacting protein p29 [Aphelenchus avenae]